MSRFTYLVLALASLMLIGCVSVPKGSATLQRQAELMVPPAGKAGVYIFRPSLFGSGALVLWAVKLDSIHFGDLAPRSYLYGIVRPGRHSVGGEVKGSLPATTFNAEEGNNYYFKLSLFSGLIPIKADEARQLINEFTLSKYNIFENIKKSVFSSSPANSVNSNVKTTHHEGINAFKSGDYSTAYDLYRLPADQGDVEAQLMLSRMYAEGLGIAKDDLKAIEWHAIAVEGGGLQPDYCFI